MELGMERVLFDYVSSASIEDSKFVHILGISNKE